MAETDTILLAVPVSRAKGLLRAAPRLLIAAILGVFVWQAFGRIRWRPIGTTNFLVEYSLLIVLLPMALLDLWLWLKGVQWLLLAIWPGPVALLFGQDGMELRLGSFGRCRLDMKRLELRYPHEMDPSEAEEPFEVYEDPQQQEASRLPIMRHPDWPGRLDWLIRSFSSLEERETARRLRPFVEAYRQTREQPTTGDQRAH